MDDSVLDKAGSRRAQRQWPTGPSVSPVLPTTVDSYHVSRRNPGVAIMLWVPVYAMHAAAASLLDIDARSSPIAGALKASLYAMLAAVVQGQRKQKFSCIVVTRHVGACGRLLGYLYVYHEGVLPPPEPAVPVTGKRPRPPDRPLSFVEFVTRLVNGNGSLAKWPVLSKTQHGRSLRFLSERDEEAWGPMRPMLSLADFCSASGIVSSGAGRSGDSASDVVAREVACGRHLPAAIATAVGEMYDPSVAMYGVAVDVLGLRGAEATACAATLVQAWYPNGEGECPVVPDELQAESFVIPCDMAHPACLSLLMPPKAAVAVAPTAGHVAAFAARFTTPDKAVSALNGAMSAFADTVSVDYYAWTTRSAAAYDAAHLASGPVRARLLQLADSSVENTISSIFDPRNEFGSTYHAICKYYIDVLTAPTHRYMRRPLIIRDAGMSPLTFLLRMDSMVYYHGLGGYNGLHVFDVVMIGACDVARKTKEPRLLIVVPGEPGTAKSFVVDAAKDVSIKGFFENRLFQTPKADTAAHNIGHMISVDDAGPLAFGFDGRAAALNTWSIVSGILAKNSTMRPDENAAIFKQAASGSLHPVVVVQAWVKQNGERMRQSFQIDSYGTRVYTTNLEPLALVGPHLDRLHVVPMKPDDAHFSTRAAALAPRNLSKGMVALGASAIQRTQFACFMYNTLVEAGHCPPVSDNAARRILSKADSALVSLGVPQPSTRTTLRRLTLARALALRVAVTLAYDVYSDPIAGFSVGHMRSVVAPFAYISIDSVMHAATMPGAGFFLTEQQLVVLTAIINTFFSHRYPSDDSLPGRPCQLLPNEFIAASVLSEEDEAAARDADRAERDAGLAAARATVSAHSRPQVRDMLGGNRRDAPAAAPAAAAAAAGDRPVQRPTLPFKTGHDSTMHNLTALAHLIRPAVSDSSMTHPQIVLQLATLCVPNIKRAGKRDVLYTVPVLDVAGFASQQVYLYAVLVDLITTCPRPVESAIFMSVAPPVDELAEDARYLISTGEVDPSGEFRQVLCPPALGVAPSAQSNAQHIVKTLTTMHEVAKAHIEVCKLKSRHAHYWYANLDPNSPPVRFPYDNVPFNNVPGTAAYSQDAIDAIKAIRPSANKMIDTSNEEVRAMYRSTCSAISRELETATRQFNCVSDRLASTAALFNFAGFSEIRVTTARDPTRSVIDDAGLLGIDLESRCIDGDFDRISDAEISARHLRELGIDVATITEHAAYHPNIMRMMRLCSRVADTTAALVNVTRGSNDLTEASFAHIWTDFIQALFDREQYRASRTGLPVWQLDRERAAVLFSLYEFPEEAIDRIGLVVSDTARAFEHGAVYEAFRNARASREMPPLRRGAGASGYYPSGDVDMASHLSDDDDDIDLDRPAPRYRVGGAGTDDVSERGAGEEGAGAGDEGAAYDNASSLDSYSEGDREGGTVGRFYRGSNGSRRSNADGATVFSSQVSASSCDDE